MFSADILWGAGANANVLVAVATLALAVETWRMAKAATRATEHAERTTEAAEQTVQAAREQLVEVARGRIDAAAPMVAWMVGPSEEPCLLTQRGPLPQNGGFFLLSSAGTHSSRACQVGEEFTFDRDAEGFLWFSVPCHIWNEGRASVWVRVDAESVDTTSRGRLGEPGVYNRFLLRPGEAASFLWADGHTLREWADGAQDNEGVANPNRHLRLALVVEDVRRSVVDYLFGEVGGSPLELVPGTNAQWRIASTRLDGTVYPTRRWYRHEGGPYPMDPWNEAIAAASSVPV